MGSRDRSRKRKLRAVEMTNVHLSGIFTELQTVLSEAGLPCSDSEMVDTVRSLVEALRETGALAGAQGPTTDAPVPPRSAQRQRPSQLLDGLDLAFEDEPEPVADLDDPSLWELEDPGTVTAGPTGPSPAQHPAGVPSAPPMPPGGKSVGTGLDQASAMQKLQDKLARAEKEGIKRGMPGMGGRSVPLVKGGSDKTPLDDQRAIMENLLGRPQKTPPPGRLKP